MSTPPINVVDAFRWWTGRRLDPDHEGKLAAASYLDSILTSAQRAEFGRLYRQRPVAAAVDILMTFSGQWTRGLRVFRLQLRNNGQVVDEVQAFSGSPRNQTLVHPAKDYAGSCAPIYEGVFVIGAIEEGNWGAGIGRYWVDLTPLPEFRLNNRSALGFHIDANFEVSPGSAGCVVLQEHDWPRLLQWLRAKARPRYLIVDHGFGLVRQWRGDRGVATSAKLQTNAAGLKLIKDFEGLRLQAYRCPSGVWTIGYGHTKNVQPGQTISREEAERFFQEDIAECEACVTQWVKVPLTTNQFSALVSFVFNCGCNAFRQSTLLRLLNQGDYQGAADQLLRWINGDKGPLEGLRRRREAERKLFLS